MKQPAMVLLGAAVGGALGWFAVYLLRSLNLEGVMLPGVLIGVGASSFRCRVIWPAITCGLLALVVCLLAEWWFFPWAKDQSLVFFLQHLHDQSAISLLLIALGGVVGFWAPYSRWRYERSAPGPEAAAGPKPSGPEV